MDIGHLKLNSIFNESLFEVSIFIIWKLSTSFIWFLTLVDFDFICNSQSQYSSEKRKDNPNNIKINVNLQDDETNIIIR